jgi:hypothetical protein
MKKCEDEKKDDEVYDGDEDEQNKRKIFENEHRRL